MLSENIDIISFQINFLPFEKLRVNKYKQNMQLK